MGIKSIIYKGRTYLNTYSRGTRSKRIANDRANKWRNQGLVARIKKTKDGVYDVFVAPSKRKRRK